MKITESERWMQYIAIYKTLTSVTSHRQEGGTAKE